MCFGNIIVGGSDGGRQCGYEVMLMEIERMLYDCDLENLDTKISADMSQYVFEGDEVYYRGRRLKLNVFSQNYCSACRKSKPLSHFGDSPICESCLVVSGTGHAAGGDFFLVPNLYIGIDAYQMGVDIRSSIFGRMLSDFAIRSRVYASITTGTDIEVEKREKLLQHNQRIRQFDLEMHSIQNSIGSIADIGKYIRDLNRKLALTILLKSI